MIYYQHVAKMSGMLRISEIPLKSRAGLGGWAFCRGGVAGSPEFSNSLTAHLSSAVNQLSLEVTELDPKLDGPIELRTHFSDLCQNKNVGDGAGYQFYQFVWERDKISLRQLRLRLSGYNSIRFDTLTLFRQ